MKILALVLLLTPFSSHGLWSYNVINNGVPLLSADLLFPVSYTHSSCQFETSVINNGVLDEVFIINTAGCFANNHFFVIDGYMYALSDTVEIDFYADLHLYSETDFMTGCSSATGPIPTESPRVNVSGLSAQFLSNEDMLVFIHSGNIYFKYESINGDIICDNAIEFVDPSEIIFQGGFEP